MRYLIILTLFVTALILVVGCRSQASGEGEKAIYPPWRNSVKVDEISARQRSIQEHLLAPIARVTFFEFYILRYDAQTGLEYYIFTDGGFDGLLIVFVVDSANDTVSRMGYYNLGGDGWHDVNIKPFRLDLQGN